MSQIHPQARTTPCTRAEIKESATPLTELTERYNVGPQVEIARDAAGSVAPAAPSVHHADASRGAIVVELRRLLLLPLDDLLVVCREFINPPGRVALGPGPLPAAPRHGQPARAAGRCAGRNRGARLHPCRHQVPATDAGRDGARRYLFMAIDRATRWAFLRISPRQDEAAATDFLRRLCDAAPMKIQTVLTDNCGQFTDRFTSKARTPSGAHAFGQCLAIEHRLCPPHHPQTNGTLTHASARSSVRLASSPPRSWRQRSGTQGHRVTYNHRISQKALKRWQAQHSELFRKRFYEPAGLDSTSVLRPLFLK